MTPLLFSKDGELEKAVARDASHQNEVWQAGPPEWRGFPACRRFVLFFHHIIAA
jgi:hypothetical protein